MNVGQIINTLVNVHPWHIQLVHFPIALTTVGLLFMVLALLRQDEFLERAAFYSMTLVAISAALACAAGYHDSVVRYEGNAPLVPVKVFLGLSLVVLATITVVLRGGQAAAVWQRSSSVLYLVAFLAGFAIAAVLGFFGGVIVYGI